MHKDAIQNSKKVGLLNLVKSPIGASKAVSKTMKILMNLLSQVGNLKRDRNPTHTWFYLDKIREDDMGKKQVNYTYSSFSFLPYIRIKQTTFQKK